MINTGAFDYSPIDPVTESQLHEVLDPDGRIPTDYSITSSEECGWIDERGHTVKWRIYHDGDDVPIGRCFLNAYTNNGDNNYVCFDGVEITKSSFRGKGYGLAIYLEAILYAHERGLPFRTQDWDQTEYAVRIWNLLHSSGVAREETPFVFDHTQSTWDHEQQTYVEEARYKGVYVVDPPKRSGYQPQN